MHTKIRPKDVPGTLLNVALLNLGSSDPSLRSAAYNLLCSLTQTFELRIESQLLETAGASEGWGEPAARDGRCVKGWGEPAARDGRCVRGVHGWGVARGVALSIGYITVMF